MVSCAKSGSRGIRTLPSQPRIVGAGLVTLDIVIDSARQSVTHSAGGTCGNVLAALAYLGWSAKPVALLGDDVAADTINADLEASGASIDALVREQEYLSTRIAQHVIQSRRVGRAVRHRFAFSCPTCGKPFSRFRPPTWEQYESVTAGGSWRSGGGTPDVFFFDRVSTAILEMARAFRKEGSLIYFEPSRIGRLDQFREAIALSHVVKYSRERLHVALATLGGLAKLTNRRPQVEIETRGAEGLRFRVNADRKRGARWHAQAAFKVTNLRDAAGAGDWCSAGTLLHLGWRRGDDLGSLSSDALAKALTFGQALAALKCQYVGPRSVAHVFPRIDMIETAGILQKQGVATERSSAGESAVNERPFRRKSGPSLRRSECPVCLIA